MNKIFGLIFMLIAIIGIASVSACDVDNCTVDDCQQVDYICENNLLNLEYDVGENNTVDDNQQIDLENDNTSEGGSISINPISIPIELLSSDTNDLLSDSFMGSYWDWLCSNYGHDESYDFCQSHYGEYVEEALEAGETPEGEEIFGLYLLTMFNGRFMVDYDRGW